MSMGLLIRTVNASDQTKCVSLSSQKCMTRPTFINLHPNEYSHEFHYDLFAIRLRRCIGSCNTLNDLSNELCAPNKTEDLILSLFNMIT